MRSALGIVLAVCVLLAPVCYADVVEECSPLSDAQVKDTLQASEAPVILDNTEELNYFGCYKTTASDTLLIYTYAREFGNERMASRLIFFTQHGAYLGIYAVDDFSMAVTASGLVFDYSAEYGNTIELKNALPLPKEIWLDGEVKSLF